MVSDTKIAAIAPGVMGFDEPVVVQAALGVSNDDVTITILAI